ncbi:MAG TPA: septum formation family protein, partial [Pseudolysinimonas sp.]
GISLLQKVLLWVLGSMLAGLALVALFFLGMRLPDLIGPSPAVTGPSPSPTPSASPIILLGPVAPGEYAWNDLLGGECLDPYESPWQTTYTVVDCAAPHPAQLVHRGVIPETDPPTAFYPGEDVVQAQAIQLCRAPGIMDNAAAHKLKDLIVTVSYPTESMWNEGGRDFFCFVTQSTGEPITGDLALPQVAPDPGS